MAGLLSVVMIVVTIGLMVARGVQNPSSIFGTDFLGGSSSTLRFENVVPVDDVRKVLNGAGFEEALIQYQTELDETEPTALLIKTLAHKTDDDGDKIGKASPGQLMEKALTAAFPDAEMYPVTGPYRVWVHELVLTNRSSSDVKSTKKFSALLHCTFWGLLTYK